MRRLTETDRRKIVKVAEEMQEIDGLDMPLWHYIKVAEQAYIAGRSPGVNVQVVAQALKGGKR